MTQMVAELMFFFRYKDVDCEMVAKARSSAGHGRHSFFVVDPMAGELSQVELFNAGGSVKALGP